MMWQLGMWLWLLGVNSADFKVPVYLEHHVNFWQDVFLKYHENEVVFHDRDCPQAIWTVIVLPRSQMNDRVIESQAKTLIAYSKKDLTRRLSALGESHKPNDLIDQKLFEEAHKCVDNPNQAAAFLRDAADNLRFQRGVYEEFHRGVARMSKDYYRLTAMLKRAGLPVDLIALPLVESMYNPRARSLAGAVGVWQLLPQTARELGLKVNRYRDDRKNLIPATRAAMKLLKHNYNVFGDWPLAVTAYNHGTAGVLRHLNKTDHRTLGELLETESHDRFGFASKNYYAEFLAALTVLRKNFSF